MVWLRHLATMLFIVSVPITLILTNVHFVAQNLRVYAYSFDRYDVASVTGIARPELDRAAAAIIRYFRSDEAWLDIQVVKDGQLMPLFTEREVLHMRDVKGLFRQAFRVQTATLLYSLAYVALVVVWSRERSPREFAQQTRWAGLGTAGLVLVAGIGAGAGFDRLFEQFHLLSFRNDFWRLDPSRDHLIQMFPEGFWFDVTLLIAVLTFVEAMVIVLLSSLYLYSWRQGKSIKMTAPAAPQEMASPTPASGESGGSGI